MGILSSRVACGGINTDAFRRALERLDRRTYPDDGYWGRWLNGGELMLTERSILAPGAIEARARNLRGEHVTEPPIPEPNRPHYAPAAPGSLRTVDTPPGWYKDPAYRARIVKEPRTVLSEMAVTLYEAGTFTWRQFQAALVARIAAWEAGAVEGQPYNYYRLWLAALEDVLVDLRAVSTDEVTMRVQALAQRRQGHDHRPARDRPTHDRHPAHPH